MTLKEPTEAEPASAHKASFRRRWIKILDPDRVWILVSIRIFADQAESARRAPSANGDGVQCAAG
jgi:hypothetical protein